MAVVTGAVVLSVTIVESTVFVFCAGRVDEVGVVCSERVTVATAVVVPPTVEGVSEIESVVEVV